MFHLSESALGKLLAEYKTMAEGGEYRPSWPDLCSRMGYTEREIAAVMAMAESETSAYKGRAVMLKRAAAWMRGQYMSNPLWGGQMQSKAIFALKQDIGDGYRYADNERVLGAGQLAVNVAFGGKDTRAGKARK